MAISFKTSQLVLTRQGVTATGNMLFVNGVEVIAGVSGNLTQTGVALGNTIAVTGQQAWTAAQNNALNLSGSSAPALANYVYQTGDQGITGLKTFQQINIDPAWPFAITSKSTLSTGFDNALILGTAISGLFTSGNVSRGDVVVGAFNVYRRATGTFNSATNSSNVVMGASNQMMLSGITPANTISNILNGANNVMLFYTGAAMTRNSVMGSNNTLINYSGDSVNGHVIVGNSNTFSNTGSFNQNNILMGNGNIYAFGLGTNNNNNNIFGTQNQFTINSGNSSAGNIQFGYFNIAAITSGSSVSQNTMAGYGNQVYTTSSRGLSNNTLVGYLNVITEVSGTTNIQNAILGNNNALNLQSLPNGNVLPASFASNNVLIGNNLTASGVGYSALVGYGLDTTLSSGVTVGIGNTVLRIISGSGLFMSNTSNYTSSGVASVGQLISASGALQAQMGGTGGGVPSVNGITSFVIITGTGNFTTQTIGNTIYISGSVLTSDQQLLFDKSGVTSGSDLIRWDYTTGTLEIGQPALNYPDNPLSLGGTGRYLQANIRNRSLTNDASADWIATSDIGSDVSGYINLGINNSNYNQSAYDIGSGNDGYLYINNGNLALGTATSGDVINFHTAGTRYFNLRATINDTGILMPETGLIQFGSTISGTRIDSTSIDLGLLTISGVGLAGKPGLTAFSTGWGNTYYQAAFYDNRSKFFSPNAAATQSLWGDTAANVGTLLLTTSQVLGDYTQITPAAGLSAGLSATTASIYRGSVPGLNGFFFSSKFILNTASGNGHPQSSYGAPSGCRIFVGLTDQAVATQVGLNEPAGSMIGLNYLWASGGAVGTGQYMQNWAIRTRNNVATTTGDIGMTFQTGFYRFSMFCPPFPNNNAVQWEMMDLIRGSGVCGTTTATLPVGSTAMRPMTALGFVSGIKVIGCSTLYVEKQGSYYD